MASEVNQEGRIGGFGQTRDHDDDYDKDGVDPNNPDYDDQGHFGIEIPKIPRTTWPGLLKIWKRRLLGI